MLCSAVVKYLVKIRINYLRTVVSNGMTDRCLCVGAFRVSLIQRIATARWLARLAADI